eukprot:1161036-Pelagomonas_calceolata.AAC.8
MLGNVALFCLHAHTLKFETPLWQEQTYDRDRCERKVQGNTHAVFLCSCVPMCYPTRIFAHLFPEFPLLTTLFWTSQAPLNTYSGLISIVLKLVLGMPVCKQKLTARNGHEVRLPGAK